MIEMVFAPTEDEIEIINVWSSNLDSEFEMIRSIVHSHRYIGLDTEFPGTIFTPLGNPPRPYPNDVGLTNMIVNVNATKLIQLGLTFMNDEGFPPMFNGKYRVWQFNFREFDVENDLSQQDSIALLMRNNIDFTKTRNEGVSAAEFANHLMPSGVVMADPANPEPCKWLTFQGSCDYGYLLKMLTGKPLVESEFLRLMALFFPESYDVRQLGDPEWGGLARTAIELKVDRIGQAHQAGSDSLLTSCVFMKLKRMGRIVFGPQGNAQRYVGVLYGINS